MNWYRKARKARKAQNEVSEFNLEAMRQLVSEDNFLTHMMTQKPVSVDTDNFLEILFNTYVIENSVLADHYLRCISGGVPMHTPEFNAEVMSRMVQDDPFLREQYNQKPLSIDRVVYLDVLFQTYVEPNSVNMEKYMSYLGYVNDITPVSDDEVLSWA